MSGHLLKCINSFEGIGTFCLHSKYNGKYKDTTNSQLAWLGLEMSSLAPSEVGVSQDGEINDKCLLFMASFGCLFTIMV